MKKAMLALGVVVVLIVVGWMVYSLPGTPTPTVNQAAPTGDVLNLSSSGLSSVGPSVYGRTSITELNLSNNNLKTLPSQMGNLTNVRVLHLDHNQLEGSLIAEVRKMPLEILDVSYNNMTGMPAEIGQLSKLRTLNYSYNNLTGLPNELAHLKGTLKTFYLTGNPLSSETIAKLRAQLPNTTIIF